MGEGGREGKGRGGGGGKGREGEGRRRGRGKGREGRRGDSIEIILLEGTSPAGLV